MHRLTDDSRTILAEIEQDMRPDPGRCPWCGSAWDEWDGCDCDDEQDDPGTEAWTDQEPE